MYMGVLDWTISLNSDNLYNAFDVLSGGYVDADFVSGNSGVRPSFNLLSSTTYVSGSGSMSDPVRIN